MKVISFVYDSANPLGDRRLEKLNDTYFRIGNLEYHIINLPNNPKVSLEQVLIFKSWFIEYYRENLTKKAGLIMIGC